MTEKELASIQKKSIHAQNFSSTTKTAIIANDLQKLLQTIRKLVASNKSVSVLVFKTDKWEVQKVCLKSSLFLEWEVTEIQMFSK